MHSWRVLLLPYLGEKGLHSQYNFNEPWNGPNNGKLACKMPSCFVCPGSSVKPPLTNYVAVVGPQAAWRGAEPMKEGDISDGLDNTILLVEVADSDINWMEPRDLSFEQALAGVNPDRGQGISSPHVHEGDYFHHDEPVAHVDFVDKVVPLHERMSPNSLKALLTANGGETIDWDSPEFTGPKRIHWPHVLAVVALVVSVVLLVWCVWTRGVIVFVDR